MMQFIADDPLYKIIRITGPTHNLLGLQVSLEPTIGDPEVEALDHPSSSSGGLNGREVAEQVMLGVEQASIDLKKRYYVAKIQYISTDSPPVTVYRQLAIEIIRRIEASRSQRRSEQV